MNLTIHTFRYLRTTDPFDDSYPHWSRKYEYPTVLKELKERVKYFKDCPTIHNTSWGFDSEHHTKFKNELEGRFLPPYVTNSDIVYTGVPNTCYYDLTLPTPEVYKEAFDFVLNLSALEEIPGDHDLYLSNLAEQVRPGGYLICTFDYPGLRSNILEHLNPKPEDCIVGDISHLGGPSELNVLYLVAQKT
jgi:SAM-dependent methyltransferase